MESYSVQKQQRGTFWIGKVCRTRHKKSTHKVLRNMYMSKKI